MPADLIRWMHLFFLPVAKSFDEPRWQPAADVYRTRNGWLAKFDLAGIRPEDIGVAVSGRRLTIRGSRRDSFCHEANCHYLMEIAYSHFERAIQLPCDIELAHVTTEYLDGMLLVHIQTEIEP